MKFPEELRYTKEHSWVKIENGKGTIGITEFAQSELGDIIYVDLPNPGITFPKDKIFGSVEAVKTVSDLFMPVSGKVLEVNTKLKDDPKLVNSEPYSDGWLIKIEILSKEESSQLLSANAYAHETGN